MSDNAVTEMSKDPITQGQIRAFRQVLEGINEKRQNLPERIAYNDGARSGVLAAIKILEDYIQLIIKNDKQRDVEIEVIKQKRDLILDAKRNVEKIGQEFLQEHIMLKGEARALLQETEMISKLHKQSLVAERTRATMQEQQDTIRQQQGRDESDNTKVRSIKTRKLADPE